MRGLVLVWWLLLLTGHAVGEINISGKVVDQSEDIGLGGVVWRVNVAGAQVLGETEGDGSFTIPLPEIPGRLTVSFSKDDYEQMILVLDRDVVRREPCELPMLRLSRNRQEELTPDPDEIDSLDSYYRREGRSLYLLVSSDLTSKAGDRAVRRMSRRFQKKVTDHLQALPVVPPPPDITAPATVPLEVIDDLQEALEDADNKAERIRLYGGYLEALAIINGDVEPGASPNDTVCIRFDYQMIPFYDTFGPIREVVFYALPANQKKLRSVYDKISQRWGFYTLLALCARELIRFDKAQDEGSGDRSRLKRVRAYLVAELSQLGPSEQLERGHIRTLLEAIDRHLE